MTKEAVTQPSLQMRPSVTDTTGLAPFEDLPTLLARLRSESGLSQGRLAQLTGMNHSSISRVENGERNIGADGTIALLDALKPNSCDALLLTLLGTGISPNIVNQLVLAYTNGLIEEIENRGREVQLPFPEMKEHTRPVFGGAIFDQSALVAAEVEKVPEPVSVSVEPEVYKSGVRVNRRVRKQSPTVREVKQETFAASNSFDEDSSVPRYLLVAKELLRRINTGVYAEMLPPESVLTEEMGYSRGTIREAIFLLAEKRIVTKHQGIGTLISPTLSVRDIGRTIERKVKPTYERIALELERRILNGDYVEILPTQDELFAEFGCSRGTVLQALRLLREKKLVISKQGMGTLVNRSVVSSLKLSS